MKGLEIVEALVEAGAEVAAVVEELPESPLVRRIEVEARSPFSVPVSRDAFDLPWFNGYEPPIDPTGARAPRDE